MSTTEKYGGSKQQGWSWRRNSAFEFRNIPKLFYSKPHKSLTLPLFLSRSGRDTSLKKWVLMAALELCPWLEFFFFFFFDLMWILSYLSSSSSSSISVNCEVWSKPKTHTGRIFSFGRYLPKHTGMTEMPRNWLNFDPRWNKGYSGSGLYTGTRNSIRSGRNGIEFITMEVTVKAVLQLSIVWFSPWQ